MAKRAIPLVPSVDLRRIGNPQFILELGMYGLHSVLVFTAPHQREALHLDRGFHVFAYT